MNDEDKLRAALHADTPHVEVDPGGWDVVRERGRSIHRRRWTVRTGLAVVAVIAIVFGIAFVTGTFDRAASRSITATPTPAGNDQGDIVATLDHSIVVLSLHDGHVVVVRTIVDGLDALGSVAVSPDGRTVYYTHDVRTCSDGRQIGGGIAEVPMTGGTPVEVLAPASDPIISPDGRWLAYSSGNCESPQVVGVRSLSGSTTVQEEHSDGPNSTGPAMPVSWSANSQQLFYLGDEGDLYRLDGIPQPSGPPTNLTTGIGPISAATTTPDGHVLIARQEANTYIIQHFDPVPRGIDMRFVGIGPTPTAMSLDANDRLLLRFSGGADGSLSVQDGSSTDQSGPSAGQPGTDLPHLIHGVHGAAWIPGATSTSPATPTTGPSTTTSPNAVIIPTPTTATTLSRRCLPLPRSETA